MIFWRKDIGMTIFEILPLQTFLLNKLCPQLLSQRFYFLQFKYHHKNNCRNFGKDWFILDTSGLLCPFLKTQILRHLEMVENSKNYEEITKPHAHAYEHKKEHENEHRNEYEHKHEL